MLMYTYITKQGRLHVDVQIICEDGPKKIGCGPILNVALLCLIRRDGSCPAYYNMLLKHVLPFILGNSTFCGRALQHYL